MTVQIINMIIPFLTIPYISRVLIPEDLGLYQYTQNVVTYFSLTAELGFQFYGQKLIVGSRNKEEEEIIFFKILKLKLIFGFAILGVYITMVMLYFNQKLIYIFQSMQILWVIFDITWYYAGKENFKIIAMRGLFFKFASFIFLVLFVKGENALIKYVLSLQVPNLVGTLLLYVGLDFNIRKVHFKKGEVKAILLAALALLIPSILTSVYQIIDKTILGSLSSMAQVGYYSQMLKLVSLFSAIVYSLGRVVFPRIALYYKNKDTIGVRGLMQEVMSLVLHIGIPVCIGIYCVLDVFVPWFYSSQYIVLIEYFPFAIPLIILTSLNYIYSSQLLVAINEEKKLYTLIMVNVITNITFDIVFIPMWNAVGALIATLIAETIQFIGSIIFYKRIIGGKIFDSTIIKAIIAALIMGATVMFAKRLLILDNILMTLILVVMGAICYFMALVLLKDPVGLKLRKIVIRLLHAAR